MAVTRVRSMWGLGALLLLLPGLGSAELSSQELLNFERFKGNWTGSGWGFYSDQHRESATCRVGVRPYGRPDRGGIDIRCMVGTYKVDGKAFDVTLQGAKASGAWELPVLGIAGALSGRVTQTQLEANLHPQGVLYGSFTGHLSIKVETECIASAIGSIDAPTDLKRIAVTLHRC